MTKKVIGHKQLCSDASIASRYVRMPLSSSKRQFGITDKVPEVTAIHHDSY
jgi:hypothetical protein